MAGLKRSKKVKTLFYHAGQSASPEVGEKPNFGRWTVICGSGSVTGVPTYPFLHNLSRKQPLILRQKMGTEFRKNGWNGSVAGNASSSASLNDVGLEPQGLEDGKVQA